MFNLLRNHHTVFHSSFYLPTSNARATHSSTLAWKTQWTEEPGGLQSMGSLRVGHDWATSFTFHFHALEKEIATYSSVLAWRTPGTGEPGGLPSMGSHRVGHNWSDLAVAAAKYMKLTPFSFWNIFVNIITIFMKILITYSPLFVKTVLSNKIEIDFWQCKVLIMNISYQTLP